MKTMNKGKSDAEAGMMMMSRGITLTPIFFLPKNPCCPIILLISFWVLGFFSFLSLLCNFSEKSRIF